MQDGRFAQKEVDWTGRMLGAPAAADRTLEIRAKCLKDWRLVKRARFNAAKRFERKHGASVLAFAVAGICGFLVPYYTLQFEASLAGHTKVVLEFTASITGALLLIIGLIEQAKDYPAMFRRLDRCGKEVNKLLRRLTVADPVDGQTLRLLIAEYEKALDECGINHDDIDQEIARAQDALGEADPAKRRAAQSTLSRLKWRERIGIYWLYAATWLVPIAIGAYMWFTLAPAGV